MTATSRTEPPAVPLGLVARLRAAGCVFAEDEAAVLQQAARDAGQLDAFARRRVDGEPLEQLVGQVQFGGLPLSVGPGVYVPRQRTLLLARLAARAARRAPVVLEICSGVAPVAAFVSRAVPRAEVHAADVDPATLVHAHRNLPPGAGVHCGNLLDAAPRRLRGRIGVLIAGAAVRSDRSCARVAPRGPRVRAGSRPVRRCRRAGRRPRAARHSRSMARTTRGRPGRARSGSVAGSGLVRRRRRLAHRAARSPPRPHVRAGAPSGEEHPDRRPQCCGTEPGARSARPRRHGRS